MRKLNLEGQKFGKLTLIEAVGVNKAKQRMWRCLCSCGKEHIAAQQHITRGATLSCGCIRITKNFVHGMCRTPEWYAYQHAKQRCKPNHSKHAHYYDRGIRFTFTSFEQFFKEVGLRPLIKHSLDRKDNDKGYNPGNMRWATKSEQERNRRCDNCASLKQRIKELETQVSHLLAGALVS